MCPSRAYRHRDEPANERRQIRRSENCGSEDGVRYSSVINVEKVCKNSRNDSERARPEKASPEATYHDGLQVFCNRNDDHKYGKAEQ